MKVIELEVKTHTATWLRIAELLRRADVNPVESRILNHYAHTLEMAAAAKEAGYVPTSVRLGEYRPDIFEYEDDAKQTA